VHQLSVHQFVMNRLFRLIVKD